MQRRIGALAGGSQTVNLKPETARGSTGKPSLAFFNSSSKLLRIEHGDPRRALGFIDKEKLIFNDYRDMKVLETGEVSELLRLTSVYITKLTDVPVEGQRKSGGHPMHYALRQSTAGTLDIRLILEREHHGKLFVVGNVIYNAPDAGNFLWGHSLARMGVNYAFAKVGSEAFAGLYGVRTNDGMPGMHLSAWRKIFPLSLRGDDSADQRAIKHGYDFMSKSKVEEATIWDDGDYDLTD
jgi:hypothetical protein